MTRRTVFLGVGAIALCVLGRTVWLSVAHAPSVGATPSPMSALPPAPEPSAALADWCAPGYVAVHGGCLATPTSTARELVLYLHGRYAKDEATEEMDRQARLARRATARGRAVLALRGHLGACSAPELATWYCWPSTDRTAATAPDVVSEWRDAIDDARGIAHAPSTVVLGFSNGGYFASLLASRGLLEVDAFVIAHGGPVEPVRPARGTPPVLLLSADDDVAQDDMIQLDAEMTQAQWPHDAYARPGAHGLADNDIDAALDFFDRRGEPLPLQPPLHLERPQHHHHDAPEASTPDAAESPSVAQAPTFREPSPSAEPPVASAEPPAAASSEAPLQTSVSNPYDTP